MSYHKAVVILCCLFLLSGAAPVWEEASEEAIPQHNKILLPWRHMVKDDIKEFAVGDDPSTYFAGNTANCSSGENKSAESFETDVKPESAAQSEEERSSRARNDQHILNLFKSVTDILVESTTVKLENERKHFGEQEEEMFVSKDGNDSENTEDVIAKRNANLDYQNEEHEHENIEQNVGKPDLSEMQQQDKGLDSKDGKGSGSTEEVIVRSTVKLGYQKEEHEEENNQQNAEETNSSEYKESLQSKPQHDGSSEVTNEERILVEHMHDIQENIGEQESEMHPHKEYLINTDNNQDGRTVIQSDYQDDENEQQSSQKNVGEPNTSQHEENQQNEQEYYDGTTDIITTERNEQNEESEQENDQQHIAEQDSSELNLNEENLQHENYDDGATEAAITETNFNHQDEEEYKQENEQPVGEEALFETNLDGDGNDDDTTEVIVTEEYINPDHQDDEHKPDNNQQNVGESNSSEIPLNEESLQNKEEYDGATEVIPVKKNVNLDHQDKHNDDDDDDDEHNTGEPLTSENLYSEEEIHYESITEAIIAENSMDLDSHSKENQIEKKQKDGEPLLFEIKDSEEKMGDTLETTDATSIEKIPVIGTNTLIVSSHEDVTELPYSAKLADANAERMENEYSIYTGEYIEGPRSAHYFKINNAKLNDMEHKEAATEDTQISSKLNKNNTDENISREKESNDWLKLPYSEEGSGSNKIDDCAGGKEECAFLVKEWKILMPQLAMTPTPSPFDFWEYYDYSSSEVIPIPYDDPEEVLVLLPHPPQNGHNVAESLDNTAEFAVEHKVEDTNHIL